MADLILVLDRGRIARAGTHDELLRTSGLYAEIYERQLDKTGHDFSIGRDRAEHGPAGAIESFGDGTTRGPPFDRHLVIRLLATCDPIRSGWPFAFGLPLATPPEPVSPYLTKVPSTRTSPRASQRLARFAR